MSSTSSQTLHPKIARYLPVIEKVLLTFFVISVFIAYLNFDTVIYKFILLALAIVFYLMTYIPLQIPQSPQDQQYTMSDLLALTILPKVLWIASSVCLIGIAFYFFGITKGYRSLLLIGTTTGLLSMLLMLVFLVNGVRNANLVIPVLFRVIPVLLAGIYMLLQ